VLSVQELCLVLRRARALQREEGPADFVGACLFLVGEGADFMTGQILTVDGGVAFH
jgi:NAD(P)-dependent dehydrogenase (short-subunit alcohol dehydrogenase family)